MSYQLKTPKSVYSGIGCTKLLGEILKKEKCEKVALFTDGGIKSAGLVDLPLSIIEKAEVEISIFDDVPAEPQIQQVDEIIKEFTGAGCDVIVAVGGGSVMDTAKLASLCHKGACDVYDLLNDPLLGLKQCKTIMLPTTAGTGSEATPNAIVTLPEKELKVGIVNENMIADYVLLDAEFLRKLPFSIAASTGVDALAHAIECFTSKKATPFSDMVAMEAMYLLFNNLVVACGGQGAVKPDMEAKEKVMNASFFAGIAIAAASTTAVHALAYPLGGKYKIAHGVSNAMLLGPVMRFNMSACEARLAAICDRIAPDGTMLMSEKAEHVILRLEKIVSALKIPTRLKEFGVSDEDLDNLVDSAYSVRRLLDNNMAQMGKEDICMIYKQLLK